MIEKTIRKGKWLISKYKDGKCIYKQTVKNTLTTLYQNAVLSNLKPDGTLADMRIKFFFFFFNDTAAQQTDTSLYNETYRQSVTTGSINNNRLMTVLILPEGVATGAIKEIGVFIGDTATSTPNSGVLMSRVTVDITKSENETLQLVRLDYINLL